MTSLITTPTAIELRDHQKQAIVLMREQIKQGKKRIVLKAPCSFGKTLTAAYMAKQASAKGKRTIFLCDRIELIQQASAAFDRMGIHHGIIQADNPRNIPSAPVQVASVQTLEAKRKRHASNLKAKDQGKLVSLMQEQKAIMPKADVWIVDECHAQFIEHHRIVQENPDAVVIGLSATPWSKGLGKLYEAVVRPIAVQELVDMGWLIEPTVYGPPVDIDLSEVKIVRGEYEQESLEKAVNKKKIVGDIVSHWLEVCPDEPTIVFAASVDHSKAIVDEFKRVGVLAEHIDGYETDPVLRKEKIERLRSGVTKVLSSVDILSKGFDYPGARCAIMARPTKSRMLFIQQAGRVMRIDPDSGKDRAVILDHAGNHQSLKMFVTDEWDEPLSMGNKAEASERKEKEKKLQEPKKCPSCFFLKPAGVHKCPACQFEPTKPPAVDVLEGKLQILKKAAGHREVKALQERFGTKQEVYSMLLGWGLAHGYKPGWTANKYRAIFDVWPRGMKEVAGDISPQLVSWIKSQQIRHSKSKKP